MIREGRSFSGNERHCCFLNTLSMPDSDGRLANISAASGLDFPDDGRAVALSDWDGDGDMDMWISNRNSPRLRFLRNDTPGDNHFLSLRLVGNGKSTNRDGIGARVEVLLEESRVKRQESSAEESGSGLLSLDSRPMIKTLRAGEGFLAQSSKWLNFGLGQATRVEKVIVRWPGQRAAGDVEEFSGLQVDGRYELVQGAGKAREITLADRPLKLKTSPPRLPPPEARARIPLVVLLPVPPLTFDTFDGHQSPLPIQSGRPVLVNLWSNTCRPCLKELAEFTERAQEIRAKGIDVVALSVDQLSDSGQTAIDSQQSLARIGFPFSGGSATPKLVIELQHLCQYLIPVHRPLALPTSFLIDERGRLAVIYKGPVSIDEMLADAAHAARSRQERFEGSAPLAGRTIPHDVVTQSLQSVEAQVCQWRAKDLFKAERYQEAVALYTEVLKLKPDSVMVQNNLGVALQALGQIEQAVSHFRQALQLDPDLVTAHRALATMMQSKGNLDEALFHLRRAVELDPGSAEGHSKLGLALQSRGNVDEAIDHLRQAIRINPEEPTTHIQLGRALRSQAKIQEAMDHFRQAVKFDPDAVAAHNLLALSLASLGQLEEAVPHFREMLRLEPDSAVAHMNLGNALNTMDRFDEALNHFHEALKIKNDYPEAHFNLGLALQSQGRLDEAITRFRQALQLAPDIAPAHVTLGIALQEQGKHDEATHHFHEAVKIDPDLADAHFELGAHAASQGRLEQAVKDYREALERNPHLLGALNNLAWILATSEDARLRDGHEAVQLALQAAEMTRHKEMAILDTLSAAYAQAGRFDGAVTTAKRALDLLPSRPSPIGDEIRARIKLFQAGKPYRDRVKSKESRLHP